MSSSAEAKENECRTINEFQYYSTILKDSQDKYERLFKLRRDLTIESKRIIFFLHSIDKFSDRTTKLKEAKQRLAGVKSSFYDKIALELHNEDPYKYLRAISPGNQEYIEALSFLSFLESGSPMGPEVCQELPFAPIIDYVLGLADFTGELMRHCINSIGIGNMTSTNDIRATIREVHRGMLMLPSTRELDDKFYVIKANVCKVERVSYNLHIMGNEVPMHLQFYLDRPERNVDEGVVLVD